MSGNGVLARPCTKNAPDATHNTNNLPTLTQHCLAVTIPESEQLRYVTLPVVDE